MTTETRTLIGSICHNDDDARDPNARRVVLWLGGDGRLMADADAPHVAHDDTFASVAEARTAARKAWSGPAWDYRDADDCDAAKPDSAYYLVTKTDRGWRLANAHSFATIDEAKAQAATMTRVACRVSRRIPATVGHGWSALAESDLVD